jgi:very-short-patch-repair endonuclease
MGSAPDREIARIARAQYGVVSRDQLIAAGLGRGAIARRLQGGRLHAVHRGVYAVGHLHLSREARWLAATLACGDGALLSHRDAAALWELRPPPASVRVHVTLSSRAGRKPRSAITIHRPRAVHAGDRDEHRGIPVTAVPLTLIDLAEIVSSAALARAIEQADARDLLDMRAIAAALSRHPRRRGSAVVRAVFDTYVDAGLTRSDLEAILLALCDAHALARPRVNALVEGLEVDFLWPAERLVVETDSRRHHATRAAFERDRARDARLTVAGYRVVRFTDRQVLHEGADVARTLRALLSRASR